jgi:hypothetical protein
VDRRSAAQPQPKPFNRGAAEPQPKGKYNHGDTRHGGQAAGTEKCSNNKSKTKIKNQNTEKSRRAQKGDAENLCETKEEIKD